MRAAWKFFLHETITFQHTSRHYLKQFSQTTPSFYGLQACTPTTKKRWLNSLSSDQPPSVSLHQPLQLRGSILPHCTHTLITTVHKVPPLLSIQALQLRFSQLQWSYAVRLFDSVQQPRAWPASIPSIFHLTHVKFLSQSFFTTTSKTFWSTLSII